MLLPQMKTNFFTSDKVIRRLGVAKARAMSRAGAKQRTVMRRLIRFRKKKKSEPGNPPFAHVKSGEFGLRTIYYAYNPTIESTVIGPLAGRKSGGESVPKKVNDGATYLKRGKNGKVFTVTLKKRPFKEPALSIYKTSYPEEYRNILK